MRVLVCIHVRDGNSRGLYLANLCRSLRFNFVGVESSGQRPRREILQSIAEARRSSLSIDKSWDLIPSKHRLTIDKNDMTSHAELRQSLCKSRRLRKRRATGHQRCRCYDAVRVGLGDRAVHPRGEAEVIRVDNQTPHAPV